MIYDIERIRGFYETLPTRVAMARERLGRPLTYSEKILYAHIATGIAHTVTDTVDTVTGIAHTAIDSIPQGGYERGKDYATFHPDRVCMQDATAQMALLQFMNAGREESAVPTTIHCDHLIRAHVGASADLAAANDANREVYDFLHSAATRYGMGFWEPGAGIIHQVVLENYAFPGGMMVGTDSHTPNAGGMGMAAIGVGGADAVDVMVGTPWELKVPSLIGVRLTGRLSGWTSPKDVILHLAGMLTVKGATNCIIEYFGPGAATLPATGKATICNMGAEVGATTSVFPYDGCMADYLAATGRQEVADMANQIADCLRADKEVEEAPERYFDQVITIELDTLKPYLNGPFTPDAACPVDQMQAKVEREGLPPRVEACLIGSCTNSSYQDLARAASVVKAMRAAGHSLKARLFICPGSELVRSTARRDGILQVFEEAGATLLANACGPCIGQWKRDTDDPSRPNSIVTTFNRNFAKRADGNANTYAFIASPEVAAGYAFTGQLGSHPCLTTGLPDLQPQGPALPPDGYAATATGTFTPPAPTVRPDKNAPVVIPQDSERLQKLAPFSSWNGKDMEALPLLIKVAGKCTTDHISMAGKWLKYRGHLQNISRNLLLGATNSFTRETGRVKDIITGILTEVWQAAEHYRDACGGSVIVAEDNYGEGSSREHAAMEPRYLGVRVVIAKSFARIHETNLKKQGVLALSFALPTDYDKVQEGDRLDIRCADITPGQPISIRLIHTDGSTENIVCQHTYNPTQIGWFRTGSALQVQ